MYIIIFHIDSSDRLNMFAFILHNANRQLVKLHDHWVSSNTSCQYKNESYYFTVSKSAVVK